MHEQVSALVDGELSIDDYLAASRAVLDDSELNATWVRYQRIRQLLQYDSAPDASGVATQVQQALVSEPTVFAPVAKRPKRAPRHRWRMAFAASIALLTIGLMPQWMQTEAPSPDLVSVPERVQVSPAYLNRYLSEHHDYLGASHVTQPNGRGSLMVAHHVQ